MSWLALLLTLRMGLLASGVDPGKLVEAFTAGDVHAVERIGRRLSARGIEPLLADDDPRTVRAAIAAAPSTPDAWELLVALGELAMRPDRRLAAPAAHAAATIATRLDYDATMLMEVPEQAVRRRLRLWRAIAARPDRWPDVRVHALEASTQLARALGPRRGPGDEPFVLAEQLADPEPELRRAAVELIARPPSPGDLRTLGTAVADDVDPVVALVAAGSACAGLAAEDPAAPILAALGGAGLARMRALVREPGLPEAALVDVARCLAADATADKDEAGAKASLAALSHLARHAPKTVRADIAALARDARR